MMITPEQLAEIKARLPGSLAVSNCDSKAENDVAIMFDYIERLQSMVKVKDAALAILGDRENWSYSDEETIYYEWSGASSPIDLAERALTTTGENE